MITKEQLVNAKLCDAATADKWIEPLNAAMDKFGINTPVIQAHFLSQISHESGKFRATSENLNYSAEGLVKIFGKYFTPALAAEYARKPEMIASRVYGGRMGNGDEASKEGWKYRGRGLIQLTGKDNYTSFSKYMEDPSILENPDMVSEPEYAALSAAWFFKTRVYATAEAGTVKDVTKKINGGTIGLEDREKEFSAIAKELGV
jgi:putative chitinase